MSTPETTRFAPSPSGFLHIGHAFSALFAYRLALESGGTFLLRIEDIDPVRCRPEYEDAIYEDLSWLDLSWEKPVRRQSEHMDDYATAFNKLHEKNLLYPCFCTRKDIQEEISRSGSAAHHSPEGLLYPGLCRHMDPAQAADKIAAGEPYALRLDLQKALKTLEKPLTWHDRDKGMQTATPEILGDVVLARKDIGTSYHLSVTLDDHLQGVTLVTRGEELFYATHLHRLLQALLGLNVPEWQHHKLLLDKNGNKLSKRESAATLHDLREKQGKTAADIMAMIQIAA